MSLGTCGRYELVRRIGAGELAEVFAARRPSTDGRDHPVAIKRLLPHAAANPALVGMFEDEGRLAMRLVHPNICRVYGLEQDGETPFLVMEWIPGASLRDLVERSSSRGSLPISLAIRICSIVAGALDHAHLIRDSHGRGLGIVHRDVAPPNIMLGIDGGVKLLDFGLAKARTQLHRTQPGFVKGKFGYLAPEQLQGLCDVRTDVFQLGLCLFEALTGCRVFPQDTAAETVAALGEYRAPPSARALRPDVSPEIDAVVARALAPAPNDRFQDARAMRAALDSTLRPLGHAADQLALAAFVSAHFSSGDTVEEQIDRVTAELEQRRRRPILLVLMLVLLAGALGLAAYSGYRHYVRERGDHAGETVRPSVNWEQLQRDH